MTLECVEKDLEEMTRNNKRENLILPISIIIATNLLAGAGVLAYKHYLNAYLSHAIKSQAPIERASTNYPAQR